MSISDGSSNGVAPHPGEAASPAQIVDLAAACVRFVERVTKVKLDGAPETLTVLDHYLKENAKPAASREEARDLVVLSAGAYIGEVVRKQYSSWWRLENGIGEARIELRDVFLAFSPMDIVRDALDAYAREGAEKAPSPPDKDEGLPEKDEAVEEIEDVDQAESPETPDGAFFELDDADRAYVEERLAELPAVTHEEYYAPSTRLEVLDIAIDAIRSKRTTEGDPELSLEPEDYD